MEKKYLLLMFALICTISVQARVILIYPEYRPILADFSPKATALAETVKALKSGDMTFDDVDDFNAEATVEEILDVNDIKKLLDIAQSEKFESGMLTYEQAKEILPSPLLTEALIALSSEEQRRWFIGFRILVEYLLQLESRCTPTKKKSVEKMNLEKTKTLLIKLGVFKPEEDIPPLTPSYSPQY